MAIIYDFDKKLSILYHIISYYINILYQQIYYTIITKFELKDLVTITRKTSYLYITAVELLS